jgi:hypothetical protein
MPQNPCCLRDFYNGGLLLQAQRDQGENTNSIVKTTGLGSVIATNINLPRYSRGIRMDLVTIFSVLVMCLWLLAWLLAYCGTT